MQQEEWDEIDLKQVVCPKCGRKGFLVRDGRNYSGSFVARCQKKPKEKEEDTGCGGHSVDSLITEQIAQAATKPTPKTKNGGNNSNPMIVELQAAILDLTKKVEQLMQPEKVEQQVKQQVKPKVKPDNSAFDWGRYSLEIQDRIKDELLPVLDDYPDKHIREIEKEVRSRNKYNKGIRRQVIIEVRKAWVAGVFGH